MEPDKHLTQAEKQIQRLEALRLQREHTGSQSNEKAYQPPKTVVEQTTDRLKALREKSRKPAAPRRTRIDGKQRSSKLTFHHIRALEQIAALDKRLRGSVVTRIALNRLLGLENSAEENEMESSLNEVLRQIKNRS